MSDSDHRGLRPPRPPGDADIRELVDQLMGEVVQLKRKTADSQDRIVAVLEENFPRLQKKGHDSINGTHKVGVAIEKRIGHLEQTVAPLISELEKVKTMREAGEAEVAALKSLREETAADRKASKRVQGWLAAGFGLLGASVISLGVWLVAGQFETQASVRTNRRDLDQVQARQERADAAMQQARTEAVTLTGEVRGERQRQDDRWDRIKEALDRLEKRRR